MDIKDKKILIVGLGVVGGSYAMALTAAGYKNIYAVNRSQASVDKALKAGVIKGGGTQLEEFASDADIAVIAPTAFRSLAVTGSPAKLYATMIRPRRSFKSVRSVARQRIAMISDATVMTK